MPATDRTLRNELAETLNRYSAENGSNTPDFILAEFLTDALRAFDRAVQHREAWYDRDPRVGPAGIKTEPR